VGCDGLIASGLSSSNVSGNSNSNGNGNINININGFHCPLGGRQEKVTRAPQGRESR
jgi:hypothetical protein